MYKSFYCFLIYIIIACLLFTGCRVKTEKNNEETGDFILGFSQIGAESAWRNFNTRSVQDAAERAGIQLLYFNAEQKQENQIKAIRSFILYQVDVIAFVPIVSDGWDHVLEEARDAGIPVLICDREIYNLDDSLYAGFIGTDSLQQGRSAAEYLLRKFNQETDSARTVRIVELSGTEGSSVAINRALGFREVLESHNNREDTPVFEIIFSASGDFMKSKGYELMCSILDAYPAVTAGEANTEGAAHPAGAFSEIDVIFSHNDSMTLGAIEAMKERGIRPGTDIVIVTIDAEQAAIDALKRGEVNCVVECNPNQGPVILRLASDLVRGEEIPRRTYMQEVVFSEDDDLSNIRPRGY